MKKKILERIIDIEIELNNKYKNNPNISLFSGISGLSVFYYLLFRLTNKKEYLDKLYQNLNQIFTKLNSTEMDVNYCTGLSGVALMLNILLKNKILEHSDIDESLNAMDEAIINYSLNHIYNLEDIDFLHGGLGTAHYLIERLSCNPNLKIKIVKLFEIIAQIILDDLAKYQNIQDCKERLKVSHEINCGLAHGYIAHILIFSKFLEHFPENKLVKESLRKSVECILSFESLEYSTLSQFPAIVVNRHLATYNVPLGWCYGDQPIAIAFYKASKVLNDKELLNKSLKIIEKTLQRNNLKNSVYSTESCDSSFCHGITSIGYLHKKNYFYSKNLKCLDLYKYYTKQLLEQGNSPHGLKGYYRFDQKEKGFVEDFTLLNGLIGVGVYFMDYLLNDNNNEWDVIFLLD